MNFQQIRDFVNPQVAQATGLQPVDDLQMPVPVAHIVQDLVIDGQLSDTSTNPVQNKVVKAAIDDITVQFEGGIEEAVDNWLDNNPDATTTVQDGAITYAKLDNNLKATADEVTELKNAIQAKADKSDTPEIVDPDETEADLYVCDSNGNVIAKFVDGHIVTKNFNSASIQIDLIMEADSDEADLYISDSFGNVVAEFKDGHIVTKNFDSTDMTNILGDVETLKTAVTALQSATSGILYRNKDATDGVYAACRWHQPNASAKQFCLLMGADVHGDATRTANMIEYLNAVDAFDVGIMLGDIGAWESDATWYTQAISQTNKPFLTVVGNHDAAGNMSLDATSYEYVHDFYVKFIEPNLPYADLSTGEHESDNVYYYKDFASHKIRIICVNQYDYPPDKVGDTFVYKRGENCYSQAQITWLCNTLASTPTDYAVIIALHSFPESMSTDMSNPWVSSTWFGASGSPADIMDHVNDGYIIPQIVQAWIDGTSLQKTFHYQPSGSWTECVVDVDFSSRGTGEFITYIGGHWHMSVLGKCYHYHDQKMYNVDASGLNAATQGDTPRRAGTRSEDAICALAVDRDLKKVKLFRIGAHFTKDAIDRLYGEYSYEAE